MDSEDIEMKISALSSTITMQRNGHDYTCQLEELGQLDIRSGKIVIADADGYPEFKPIKVKKGSYTLFRYVWKHVTEGDINVFLVVRRNVQKSIKNLEDIYIEQDYAPHLDGVPIDVGEIVVRIDEVECFRLDSGLGDGAYPVYGNEGIFTRPDVLVVDFKIWNCRKYIPRSGWELDQYGISIQSNGAD